ncbi:Increased loss of mitochondrial DNA protein 1 [Elaphomyces granulatus]|jgi:hypothetical protein
MAAYLNSKRLIQGHALFLFILAVYLTKSPEVITDSDVVYFTLRDTIKIDIPLLTRPQSPFAFCGVLLVADALVDLIIVTKMPQINEIMATVHVLGSRSRRGGMTRAAAASNQLITRAATLYSEIWMLLAASRICLFFAVSFFIHQSKPSAWGLRTGAAAHDNSSSLAEAEAIMSLNKLKTQVVLVYGFVEMIFWFWILQTLRDERREIVARLARSQVSTLALSIPFT